MSLPTPAKLSERLAIGNVLDNLWSETMGTPPADKQAVLDRLVEVLERSRTPYAIIGGVAVQLYSSEPRTTADIDIALRTRDDVPRDLLLENGFMFDGVHTWSENWRGPGTGPRRQRVAVQFSADDLMAQAVNKAETVHVGSLTFQLVSLPDLVSLKMVAAEEPSRRLSKRLQDLTDVVKLVEEYPEISNPELQAKIRLLRHAD